MPRPRQRAAGRVPSVASAAVLLCALGLLHFATVGVQAYDAISTLARSHGPLLPKFPLTALLPPSVPLCCCAYAQVATRSLGPTAGTTVIPTTVLATATCTHPALEAALMQSCGQRQAPHTCTYHCLLCVCVCLCILFTAALYVRDGAKEN